MDRQQLHRNWEAWATKNIGGGKDRIRIATDAAMREVLNGRSTQDAVAAARKSVSGTAPKPVRASQPAPAKATDRPRPGVITGRIVGLRQSMQPRYRSAPLTIWTFRVARTDASGRSLPLVPVEMRGRLSGQPNDGDVVEIQAHWTPGTTLRTNHIRDVTTGMTIRSRDLQSNPIVQLVKIIFILGFLAMFLAVAALMAQNVSKFQRSFSATTTVLVAYANGLDRRLQMGISPLQHSLRQVRQS
jgi:hypothetical protein